MESVSLGSSSSTGSIESQADCHDLFHDKCMICNLYKIKVYRLEQYPTEIVTNLAQETLKKSSRDI